MCFFSGWDIIGSVRFRKFEAIENLHSPRKVSFALLHDIAASATKQKKRTIIISIDHNKDTKKNKIKITIGNNIFFYNSIINGVYIFIYIYI